MPALEVSPGAEGIIQKNGPSLSDLEIGSSAVIPQSLMFSSLPVAQDPVGYLRGH
jgi:hypothetical protein